MKYKIGNTQDEIEIGQYRPMDKGPLKAFFSVVLYPSGQKIIDMRYFEEGDRRWVSQPQKVVKYEDGRKTEYIPYISYLNKDYENALKTAILHGIKEIQNDPSRKDSRVYVNTSGAQSKVQDDASSLPF